MMVSYLLTSPRKAALLAAASGVLAEIQTNMTADTANGTMVKHKILRTTPKEGKDSRKEKRNSGGRCF